MRDEDEWSPTPCRASNRRTPPINVFAANGGGVRLRRRAQRSPRLVAGGTLPQSSVLIPRAFVGGDRLSSTVIVPRPGVLSSQSRPPWRSAIRRLTCNPRPRPSPARSAAPPRAKGRNKPRSSSSARSGPASRTSIWTRLPAGGLTTTSTCVGAGAYFSALSIGFVRAWSMRPASQRTRRGAAGPVSRKRDTADVAVAGAGARRGAAARTRGDVPRRRRRVDGGSVWAGDRHGPTVERQGAPCPAGRGPRTRARRVRSW